MSPNLVKVRELIKDNSQALKLRVIAGTSGLDNHIDGKELYRPGLALAGFLDRFPDGRVQLIGNIESSFLNSLSPSARTIAVTKLFEQKIPCIFITGKNHILPVMKKLADEKKILLVASSSTTSEVHFRLTNYLILRLAPRDSIHGSLVDVYGTGLLFIGRAGIGKSEIALDLVERGHRLVADDIVDITVKQPDILIGSGPELLKQLIEIRGVGIINVREIFGVRAVRLQKRVETVVELKDWNDQEDYERLGITQQYTEYLGINIPKILLPIYPGKNITVIAEAIALNLHLNIYGYHAGKDLARRVQNGMKAKRHINDYLRWDNE